MHFLRARTRVPVSISCRGHSWPGRDGITDGATQCMLGYCQQQTAFHGQLTGPPERADTVRAGCGPTPPRGARQPALTSFPPTLDSSSR